MTPDVNSIASILGTLATGGLAAWASRSAKRTKRQEKRDDFTEIKTALNERIDDLKEDVAGQQRQITGHQEQITGQGAAISWLVMDRRSLVSTIRSAGLKPPAPRPIPERARPYLDSIDI
jgi:type II secretory pathway pseudopilin PulG